MLRWASKTRPTLLKSQRKSLGDPAMLRYLVAALTCGCLTASVGADNWPAWRGPDGQGHCAEKDLPLTWSAKENVRWKTPLADPGNSTPIIWGRRIFLTQAGDKSLWPPKGNN